MIRGFYTARTGLLAHQEHMNLISNNMANVNTVGFKSQRVSFTDLIYQNLNRPTATNPAMIGHGVRINKTDLNITQGPLQQTERFLDFALTAPGHFFAVQSPTGEIEYTRAGNFILSQDEDGTFFLATGNGDRVLNAEGEPIEIAFEQVEQNTLTDQLRLGRDGLPIPVLGPDGEPVVPAQYEMERGVPWVWQQRLDVAGNPIPILDDEGNQVTMAGGPRWQMERVPGATTIVDGGPVIDMNEIGIFTFDNPYGLFLVGNNRFVPSGNSGEAQALEQGVRPIRAGFLEGSNVEIANEMVRVIEASRAFSFSSRMIQTADEIEQTVNNLR